MSPDADMDIWTSLTVMMFAYILGPIVFGISGLFLSAIVLVLLTHYFMIVVPRLTQDLSRDQGMSEAQAADGTHFSICIIVVSLSSNNSIILAFAFALTPSSMYFEQYFSIIRSTARSSV